MVRLSYLMIVFNILYGITMLSLIYYFTIEIYDVAYARFLSGDCVCVCLSYKYFAIFV